MEAPAKQVDLLGVVAVRQPPHYSLIEFQNAGRETPQMDEIGPQIVDFMRKRIAEMGEDPSGAYDFYARRTEAGDIYGRYERFIFDHLKLDMPVSVVHAGIGIGSFIAGLAKAGVHCTGYEMERDRIACAEALRDHLGLKYDLRQARYPDDKPAEAEMLLFTNVAASWSADDEQRVINTFGRFERVVFSPRYFGRQRDDPAERAELMARIDPREVRDFPCQDYCYVEIRPRKRTRKRAA